MAGCRFHISPPDKDVYYKSKQRTRIKHAHCLGFESFLRPDLFKEKHQQAFVKSDNLEHRIGYDM